MKKIIHLSDLHFGTEEQHLVDCVIAEVNKIKPDIVIVSGDLTQRARPDQFKKAKQFLDKIKNKSSLICVPGNHDIPLYNLCKRLFNPFGNYNKYIGKENFFTYSHGDLAILGINSVTRYKPMGGFITDNQLAFATQFFAKMSQAANRIIVMHHNLIRSERHKIINNSEKILNLFAACKVNLVLSGHIHEAHVELLKRNYLSHAMYVVTAGTAISTRTSDPNSFNIIYLSKDSFRLEQREVKNGEFVTSKDEVFSFIF